MSLLVRTASTVVSIAQLRHRPRHGAMTAAVYSTSEQTSTPRGTPRPTPAWPRRRILTGGLREPDRGLLGLHGTGVAPAANAAYTDAAFVANRFRIVTSRRRV